MPVAGGGRCNIWKGGQGASLRPCLSKGVEGRNKRAIMKSERIPCEEH